jgi:hypothetical protein
MLRTDARHHLVARRVLSVGLPLGVLAELALNGPGLGVGVPILIVSTLAAGWWVRRPGRALDPLDGWLPVAAVGFAALAAVRGDPLLAFLDMTVAAALAGAALAAMSGLAVTRRTASAIIGMATMGLGSVLVGAASTGLPATPSRELLPRSMPGWMAPVGRGLIVGLPLGTLFVVLFASADPIFRGTVEDVIGFRVDLGDLPGRALFALSAAWLLAGAVSIAATGMPALERASLGAAVRTSPITMAASLRATEALVALIVIDAVIGGFVTLQLAYLFGGLDTLVAAGMPYAEYARRGFFELAAAAGLASAVVVALEATIQHRTRFYLAAIVLLIVLTLVVLVSAALRLDLYQQAYGWTELRLYVVATIVAMGVGLLLMLVLVLAQRSRWLPHGVAVVGLVVFAALNLIAPAAFVAARNTDRAIDPSLVAPGGHAGLDAAYLAVLPDDAIPVLVDALPRLPGREGAEVRAILVERRRRLASEAPRSPLSWNLGWQRARVALEGMP